MQNRTYVAVFDPSRPKRGSKLRPHGGRGTNRGEGALVSRVLVLGGSGMLGHELWRTCSERFDAYATIRSGELQGPAADVLDSDRTMPGVRVEEPRSVARALDEARADAVVNCIGIVKQAVDDPAPATRVNALFPHDLAAACHERGARLIHISTDCVFSGGKGGYIETDHP